MQLVCLNQYSNKVKTWCSSFIYFIFYLQIIKDATRKVLQMIGTHSRVIRYKINPHKSVCIHDKHAKKLAGKIVQSTKASNWSVVLSKFLSCFKPLPDDLVPFCFFPITNLVSESLKLADLRIFLLAVYLWMSLNSLYCLLLGGRGLENLDSFRYFLRLYWLLPSALKCLEEWSVSIMEETGTP